MKSIGLFLALVILIVGLTTIAANVQRNNGIPDIFADISPKSLKNKEDAQALETLQAPFAAAENAAQPVDLAPDIHYDPLGGSVVVSQMLNIPHRHEADVSKWIVKVLSEVLTFSIADYAAHNEKQTKVMSPNAISELQSFMDTSNILNLMKSQNYELRSFTRNVPELLNSGAVSGRFRWVYDVPMSLSFLPVGDKTYDEMDKNDYRIEELTFRIQLGRVEKGKGYEGMLIETWETLKRKRKEKK